jgi:hypothetical protein
MMFFCLSVEVCQLLCSLLFVNAHQVDWDGYTIGYYGRIFEARNKTKGGSFEVQVLLAEEKADEL